MYEYIIQIPNEVEHEIVIQLTINLFLAFKVVVSSNIS